MTSKKPKEPTKLVLVIDTGTHQEVRFPRTFLKEHSVNVLNYRDTIAVRHGTMRRLLERRLVER